MTELFGLVAASLLVWLLVSLVFRRWSREMVEEFVKEFPDVCPACSFSVYMLMYHGDASGPRPHDCCGKLSQWEWVSERLGE